MSVEERIGYLLRVAARAEGQGELRVARAFRRMAEEARPLGVGSAVQGRSSAQRDRSG